MAESRFSKPFTQIENWDTKTRSHFSSPPNAGFARNRRTGKPRIGNESSPHSSFSVLGFPVTRLPSPKELLAGRRGEATLVPTY